MSDHPSQFEPKLPPQFLECILDDDFQPFALFSHQLRFTYANRRFCNLLGHPPTADLTGFHLSLLPVTEQPEFRDFIFDWTEGTADEREFFYTDKSPGQPERVLAVRFRRLQNPRFAQHGIIVLRDATQERQRYDILQQRVDQLNNQNNHLQHYIDTNLQLENFAYLASHDMKEPLRIISNFAGLLERSCQDELSEQANEYLDYIRDGVRVMNENINDLLIFTNLDRQEPQRTWVSTQTSTFIIERFLEEEVQQYGATIHTGSLPERIYADRGRFRLLLQHLMSNAIKFGHPDRPTEVRLRAEETKKEWIFTVSDNGLGVAKEYQEKIFLLFKRLHARRQYPGSGVGLAICKKIVEQHGGRIWMESCAGEGSCFHFALPKPMILLGE